MRYFIFIVLFIITIKSFGQNSNGDSVNMKLFEGRIYEIIRKHRLDSMKIQLTDTNALQIIAIPGESPLKEYYSIPENRIVDKDQLNPKVRMQDSYLIFVINKSSKEIKITTYESYGFYMQQEAKDKYGAWKPIENIYSSECRNAYDPFILKPKSAYSTYAKNYSGSFQTEVRFKLLLTDSYSSPQYFYSKPFIMKIDPKRFDYNFH